MSERGQVCDWIERPRHRFTRRQRIDFADRKEIGFVLAFALPLSIYITNTVRDQQRLAAGDRRRLKIAPNCDFARFGVSHPDIRFSLPAGGLLEFLPARQPARNDWSAHEVIGHRTARHDMKAPEQNHCGQNRAENHQHPAFNELHPGRRHHSRRHDDQHDNHTDGDDAGGM